MNLTSWPRISEPVNCCLTAVSLAILMRWRCILNQINVNIGWDVRLAGQSANSLLQR